MRYHPDKGLCHEKGSSRDHTNRAHPEIIRTGLIPGSAYTVSFTVRTVTGGDFASGFAEPSVAAAVARGIPGGAKTAVATWAAAGAGAGGIITNRAHPGIDSSYTVSFTVLTVTGGDFASGFAEPSVAAAAARGTTVGAAAAAVATGVAAGAGAGSTGIQG